ncbi:hypothetical protein CTAM01_16729 [Colletotrichum tamarilloi]|uniref:Uncharacterized protein n=1 Tax=Colletotrichum tamarilloi TaxID=1209934 RepID=A0ABQ9QHN7_9PEZI|nr:uncharacterized protein CTAM01_16729 [Colletotrichum tamarilloi]KAK1470907.1 hypothetical protein CTAM01_16729 [Colletotrichum tamarilloi]
MKAAVLPLLGAQLIIAAETSRWWGAHRSNTERVSKGNVEWALRHRTTELGFPGGQTISWRWIQCTETDEYESMDVAVVTTPRIVIDGAHTQLANGQVICRVGGEYFKC